MKQDTSATRQHYKITGSCIGCRNCLRICPVQAILTGPMRIDESRCIGCGQCRERCPGKKIIAV